jgi:prepilin-type N-terminal cleavage/methylation domain-containing protein
MVFTRKLRIFRLSRNGFTLIELLVVVGIIGILFASSIPSFSNFVASLKVKTAARQVVGLLSFARSAAISSMSPRTVSFNIAGGKIVIDETLNEPEPKILKIASGLDIKLERLGSQEGQGAGQALTFASNGSLEGRSATITFTNGSHRQAIKVVSATGAISLD